MCNTLAATGNLLAGLGHLGQAATVLYGAQRHVEHIGLHLTPMEQDMLDEGLEKVQGKKVQKKEGGRREGGRPWPPLMAGAEARPPRKSWAGTPALPTALDGGTADLAQHKAQACAMSLDELTEYALAALAEIKLEMPRKAAAAATRA